LKWRLKNLDNRTATFDSSIDCECSSILQSIIAHSIVSSRLDYANALLHGTSDRNIDRLHWRWHNSLARVVCQAPRSASATILRQQLHWLTIRQRITYKISLITYKTRITGTSTYLSNLIPDYIPTRTLRSSNKLLLTTPQMSLTMSAKSFSLSSPSMWNSLPYSCRSAKTVVAFERALKTELFAIAYGSH